MKAQSLIEVSIAKCVSKMGKKKNMWSFLLVQNTYLKFSYSLTCLCVTEIIDAKQLVVPSSQKTVAVLEGQTEGPSVSKITHLVSSK